MTTPPPPDSQLKTPPATPSASRKLIWQTAIAITLIGEGITILARLIVGKSAAEYNAIHAPPVIWQIHHLFWSIPLLILAAIIRKPTPRAILIGLAIACIASDAIHHLIVLPLWQGNTGWHWP